MIRRPSKFRRALEAIVKSAVITSLTAMDRAICRIKGHRWDDKASAYRHCFRCHKYEAQDWLEPRRKDKGK